MRLNYFLLSVVIASNALALPEFNAPDPKMINKTKGFIGKYIQESARPKVCPMKSQKYGDILMQLQELKQRFLTKCLDGNSSQIESLNANMLALQANMEAAQLAVSADTSSTASSESPAADSDASDAGSEDGGGTDSPALAALAGGSGFNQFQGAQVALIVQGLNEIIKTRECQKLKGNIPFLQDIGSLISSFSQLALVVPNQYAIAAGSGGTAFGALLNLLGSIFSNRFNFKKTEDRQTFVDLNCAFYDLRNEIDKYKIFDFPLESEGRNLLRDKQTRIPEKEAKLKAYLAESKKKEEELEKEVAKNIKLEKIAFMKKNDLDLYLLRQMAQDFEKDYMVNVDNSADTPGLTLKLTLLEKLFGKSSKMLSHWMEIKPELKLGAMDKEIPDFFKDILAKGEQFNALKTADLKTYNEKIRPQVLYYFKRILALTNPLSSEIEKRYLEWKQKDLKELETKLAKRKQLREKTYESVEKLLAELEEVKNINTFMLSKLDWYTRHDDGAEVIVNIGKEYDYIKREIYGKSGFKFLRHNNKKAKGRLKKFLSRFDDFHEKFLDTVYFPGGSINYKIKEHRDVKVNYVLARKYACQDAKPLQMYYAQSKAYTDEAYDFLATNEELFDSGIFTLGKKNFLTRKQRIQFHFKSANFAKDILDGGKVKQKNRDLYLRSKFIGHTMLEINLHKNKFKAVKNVIKKLRCNEIPLLN